MRPVIFSICSAIALTGCSPSDSSRNGQSLNSTDVNNDEYQNSFSSNERGASQSGSDIGDQGSSSGGIDNRKLGRYLAQKWQMEGYVQCAYSNIVITAGLIQNGDNATLANMNILSLAMSQARPYLDPTPDGSLVGAALIQYKVMHENDSAFVIAERQKQCIHDLGEAMEAARS